MTTKDSCDVEACAAALMDARHAGRTLAGWPSRGPGAFWESFAIQAAAARLSGAPVPGWKVGNITQEQRDKSGIPSVTHAPLLAPWTMPSPGNFAFAKLRVPKLECEFAFALSRDLPARAAPYSRDEVADAVAALHPAIEIVDTRLPAPPAPLDALADFMMSGGFVYGPAVADWRKLDLGAAKMTLLRDGRPVVEGSGAAILGDPFAALVILANSPPPWAMLTAGQVVTTGSCIVPYAPDAPGRYVGDFGALGTVAVDLV